MFIEPIADGDMPVCSSDYIVAQMSFNGPINGSLNVAAPVGLCGELVSNILGVEPIHNLELERAADALKELLNVTCGRILTSLAGPDPVFEYSVPATSKLNSDELPAFADKPGTVCLLVSEKPVLLQLTVEEAGK